MNYFNSDFISNPDQYILRYYKGDVIAEKKGIWTWIKAHFLFSGSYHLPHILKRLEQISLTDQEKASLVKRIDIKKYLERHQEEKPIEDIFNRIIHNVQSASPAQNELPSEKRIHNGQDSPPLQSPKEEEIKTHQESIKSEKTLAKEPATPPTIVTRPLNSQLLDSLIDKEKMQKLLNEKNIPLNPNDPSLVLAQPNRILKDNIQTFLKKHEDLLTKNRDVQQAVIKYYDSIDLISFDELKRGLQCCCTFVSKLLEKQEYAIGLDPHTPYSWTAALSLPYLSQIPEGNFSVDVSSSHIIDFSHIPSHIKNYLVTTAIEYDEKNMKDLINGFSINLRNDPTKQLYLIIPFTSECTRKGIQNIITSMNFDKQVHLVTTNRSIKAMKDNMSLDEIYSVAKFFEIAIDKMKDWHQEFFQFSKMRKREEDVPNRYFSITEWYIPKDSESFVPDTLKHVDERVTSPKGFEFKETRFVTNFDPPYKKDRKNDDQPFIMTYGFD